MSANNSIHSCPTNYHCESCGDRLTDAEQKASEAGPHSEEQPVLYLCAECYSVYCEGLFQEGDC